MKDQVLCGFILLSSYFVLLSATCPAQCSCTTKKVDCKGNLLITDIPSGIPNDTENLELSECQIKNISMDSFKNLPNLTDIYLNKQKHGLILQDAAIFQGLRKLFRVFLNENGITSLPPGGLFANLPKLSTVFLSNNPLETLPDDLFKNSSNLAYFSVANTKLNRAVLGAIGEGKFGSNILGLFLKGTAIENLKSNFFSGLPKLNNLLVTNCQINYIQQDVLKGTNVMSIDVGENPIKSIDANAFRDNPMVTIFKCARCNLTSEFSFGFIKNMPSLMFLDLKDNKITHIRKGLFTGLKNLVLLDLSNNTIETIEKDSFAGLPKCTDHSCIQLRDNPLNCDCNLAWFYEFSKEWSDRELLKCKSPEKVAGKSFTDLDVSDFCCLNGTKCGNISPTDVVTTMKTMTTMMPTNAANIALAGSFHYNIMIMVTYFIFLKFIYC